MTKSPNERRRCTWDIETWTDDDVRVAHPCGKRAFVELSKIVKVKGRLPRRLRYPRCRRHAPPKTIEYAEGHGYRIEYLEDKKEVES
jgi:hypothetical protein